MNSSNQNNPPWNYREMTVADIREGTGSDQVQVLFLESARFYRLNYDNPNFKHLLKRLKKAKADGNVVDVGLASPNSDLIQEVR